MNKYKDIQQVKEALIRLYNNINEQSDYYWADQDSEDMALIEHFIYDCYNLRLDIEERKAFFKKELDTGKDYEGWTLTKTDLLVSENVYNTMLALESRWKQSEGDDK